MTVFVSWQILRLKNAFYSSIFSLILASLLTVLLSQWQFTQPTGKPIAIQLIQGNFAQSLIFQPAGIQKQIEFYNNAMLETNAELIVSPETAFPWPEPNLPSGLIANLQRFSNQTGSNLLFGAIGRDASKEDGREYSNRAIGLSPDSPPY